MRSITILTTAVSIGLILVWNDSFGFSPNDVSYCLFSTKMKSPAFRDGYRKMLAEMTSDTPAGNNKVESPAQKIIRANYENIENGVHASLAPKILNADYQAIGNDDATFMVQNIRNAEYDYRGNSELDPFSVLCLSCHDGSIASPIGNSTQGGSDYNGHMAGGGNHPIGMSYSGYSRRNFYVPLGALDTNILMIDGKMGCLSCHNPQNPERFHLAKSNDRSMLCLSCHIK